MWYFSSFYWKIIYTELEKKRNYYVKYEQEASNAKRAYDSSVDRGKFNKKSIFDLNLIRASDEH